MPDELGVTLQRGAVLELQLRAPSVPGTSRARLIVGASECPLTMAKPPRSVRAYMHSGNSVYLTHHVEEDGSAIRVPTDRHGRAVISGVRPGILLWVSVLDRFGTPVVEKMHIPPLHHEEYRKLEVVMPRAPTAFSGVVLDDAGRPLTDAQVKISFKDPGDVYRSRSSIGQGTDSLGQFTIADIYCENLDILIQCTGFVPFHDGQFKVPTDGSISEFRLQSGRDLLETLEREAGGLVDGTELAVLRDDIHVIADRLGAGEYRLRGLPRENVTITASVFNTSYLQAVGPMERETRITVPALGRVEALITLLDDPQREAAAYYLALIPDSDSSLSERWEPVDYQQSIWPVSVIVENVLPGNYKAVIKWEYGDVWSEPVFLDASSPISFTVAQNKVTNLQIDH